MQLRDIDSDPHSFERSLPYRFRSFIIELGAAVTAGGNGIVIYRGFKPIGLMPRTCRRPTRRPCAARFSDGDDSS
jgi:hypothetical protein